MVKKTSWTMLTIFLVQFIVGLDIAIVNVAIPSIAHSLDLADSTLQWVINAYLIVFAGFLLLGGRLADLYSRRALLLGGLIVFAIASASGGAAQYGWELLLARAFQGLAAAVMSPLCLTLVTVSFTGAAKAKAMGLWGTASAVGGAVGVLLSGILTETLNWRWVMWVNLIFVAVAILATLRGVDSGHTVDEGRDAKGSKHIDVYGAAAVTLSVMALVYGVVLTDSHGWTNAQPLSFLGVGFLGLAVFIAIEAKVSQPLMPLRFFANRAIVGANIFGLMLSAGQLASFYFISLLFQRVLGYSAIETGVSFIPFSIGVVIGVVIATILSKHLSSRLLMLGGGVLCGLGLAWFGALDQGSSFWRDALPPMIVASIAFGVCFIVIGNVATHGVAEQEAGLASGILNSVRTLGGAVGLAVLVTLATSHTDLRDGYSAAFLAAGIFVIVGAAVGSVIIPKNMAEKTTEQQTTEANKPETLESTSQKR